MKIFKIAGMLLMLVFVGQLGFAQNTGSKMSTVKIKTSALCDMCKDRIEKGLTLDKGIQESKLNVDNKIITVVFDPQKTTVEKIKKEIAAVGYDADNVKADASAYKKLPGCCKKP